ncbi:hypothetical protein GDO86_014566 [Hymenochirus boettgeri]|uniref:Uncharacterized protein n=1 Tax=Hymenochirus boettgeri TaxID=247094 RepID=A0A8T2JU81_9PIPI|nr:hypothetical protein GDO86_014566 [Hymenochirus boettgeri]
MENWTEPQNRPSPAVPPSLYFFHFVCGFYIQLVVIQVLGRFHPLCALSLWISMEGPEAWVSPVTLPLSGFTEPGQSLPIPAPSVMCVS